MFTEIEEQCLNNHHCQPSRNRHLRVKNLSITYPGPRGFLNNPPMGNAARGVSAEQRKPLVASATSLMALHQ